MRAAQKIEIARSGTPGMDSTSGAGLKRFLTLFKWFT